MSQGDSMNGLEEDTINPANGDDDSAFFDAENGLPDNSSLPRIPEAFLVEDSHRGNNDDYPVVVAGHAEVIPPWYKQTRTKVFFVIIVAVVAMAAVGVSLSFSRSNNEYSDDASSGDDEPLLLDSTNETTSEPTTISPSSSLAPSNSPTTCAKKVSSAAQKIKLPLSKPSDIKIAVDGRNMIVAGRDLQNNEDDVSVTFYALSEEGKEVKTWERVDMFWAGHAVSDSYGVALSGNTVFVGLPNARITDGGPPGGIIVYEQNEWGFWKHTASLGGNFGSSVDVDGNLACASSYNAVHMFRRDTGGTWAETDVRYLPQVDGCHVAGNTVAFMTLGQTDSFSGKVTYPRAVGFGAPYLALHSYDEDLDELERDPLQGLYFQDGPFGNFQDVTSIELTEDHLAVVVGNNIGVRDVFIYHRQDSSQQFSLLQNFSSTDYFDFSMDNDLLVISEQNQTIVLSEQSDGNWEEALVLDRGFIDHEISGRHLLGKTGDEEVYYFHIEDCVQNTPTQYPSFSARPSGEASSAPSAHPTESPSAAPSTTATPTRIPSMSPSSVPSATALPTQSPSSSTSPSDTCYWINIKFDYPWWCYPSWDIKRISSDGIFQLEEMHPDWVSGMGESKSICMPEGYYEFTTAHDPENAVAACCSGRDVGSYNATLDGVVIAEGKSCYKERMTSFSLPFLPSLAQLTIPTPSTSSPDNQ